MSTARKLYDDYQEKTEIDLVATINIIKAHTFDDAKVAGTSLSNGNTVLLNIKEMDQTTLSRVLDYLGGYTDSCQGKLARMSEELLMICPYTVEIDGASSVDWTDQKSNSSIPFKWERK